MRFDGVKRHVPPPPAGAIILVPAGTPGQVRWNGGFDWLHVYLEPRLVERIAAEAFGLDPVRLTAPPLDFLDLPPLRAAMAAVGAELESGGAGGPLVWRHSHSSGNEKGGSAIPVHVSDPGTRPI